jgi:hypothetical protein
MLPPLPDIVPSDADALPRLLTGMLDDHDLRVIAAADHGFDTDAHLAALRRLMHMGTRAPIESEPREVLELTRWDEPPHEPIYERAHWRRAFATAALLRAYGEPENHDRLNGQNQSLVVLIDSLRALAALPLPRAKRVVVADLDIAAAAFLAWLIPHLPMDACGEHAFFGLGLLWFALAAQVPDAALVALTEWIMRAEDVAAAPWRGESIVPMPCRWLLDTTSFNQRHALWQALGTGLQRRLLPSHAPAVQEAVRLLGTMLAPASV